MSQTTEGRREGSLEAPARLPLNWKDPRFYDEGLLQAELRRVFDICHGCRRCFNLCQAFPTLFDAIDASASMELDGVPREVFGQVVDHCYLCDMCFMTKCPYVPPHEWNLDFPHLMLRAKAVKHRKGETRLRDRVLTSTDVLGRLAGIPIVVNVVNAANRHNGFRRLLERIVGVHARAWLPRFYRRSFRRRFRGAGPAGRLPVAGGRTTGRVALFATCYGNRNEPDLNEDLAAVLAHNGVEVTLVPKEVCCGMPKLELGDLEAVARAKEANIPVLARLAAEGWDIIGMIPSCVLMFKQELPLMFPDDPEVARVRAAIFDPFEYLMLRHRVGLLNTGFRNPLGRVAYHVPCHLRVQNLGQKTREVLELIPGTTVEVIERCSGHDGTYALKSEFHEASMKIGRPVVARVREARADHYGSDCPMAGHQIENGLADGRRPTHPLTLLRRAYGI